MYHLISPIPAIPIWSQAVAPAESAKFPDLAMLQTDLGLIAVWGDGL
jgi:hypothetical protein